MSPQGFSRDPPETLKAKEWFASIRFDLQRQVVVFLMWAYGFLLLTTMAILLLQGFHAWGFSLDRDLLKWLGGATVGEIGGLLFLTFRATFRGGAD